MYNIPNLSIIGIIMEKNIKIAIVGGSGLTGSELVKILMGHNYAEIMFISSRKFKGMSIKEVYPGIESDLEYVGQIGPEELKEADVLFLCMPPHDSMRYLDENLAYCKGMIIDVGSDFRIGDPGEYQRWYGQEHAAPNILDRFVYGLPEINKSKIKGAKFIANPGCYPTSALLGLFPILDSGLAGADPLIIDSKSGVTGAGRKLGDPYLFINLNENFYAYNPVLHRHIGEMEQEVEKICGRRIDISFTPHLLPVARGIFTAIYMNGVDISKEDIKPLYEKYYSTSAFVRYNDRIPQIRDVAGTNNCLISAVYDARVKILKIFTAIDNLVKGAAGQAVQNMNIALGIEEGEGLRLQGINT